MKQCSKCMQWKNESEFYFRKDRNIYINECGECHLKCQKQYRLKNKEKIKKHYSENREQILKDTKKYHEKNKNRIREANRKYYQKNKGKILEVVKKYNRKNKKQKVEYDKKYYRRNRKRISVRGKKYYRKNREHILTKSKNYSKTHKKEYNEYIKKRLENSKWKLNHSVSNLIRMSLKNRKDGYRWEQLVGYTLKDLMRHLERQFTSEMNWANYGSYWQIDHVTPVSAFNFDNFNHIDFIRCWELSNLQPLEKIRNNRKGIRIDKPFQPSLKI